MKQSYNRNYLFQIWIGSLITWPMFYVLGLSISSAKQLEDYNTVGGILAFEFTFGLLISPSVFLITFLVHRLLVKFNINASLIRLILCTTLIVIMWGLLLFGGFQSKSDIALFAAFALSVMIPALYYKVRNHQAALPLTMVAVAQLIL